MAADRAGMLESGRLAAKWFSAKNECGALRLRSRLHSIDTTPRLLPAAVDLFVPAAPVQGVVRCQIELGG